MGASKTSRKVAKVDIVILSKNIQTPCDRIQVKASEEIYLNKVTPKEHGDKRFELDRIAEHPFYLGTFGHENRSTYVFYNGYRWIYMEHVGEYDRYEQLAMDPKNAFMLLESEAMPFFSREGRLLFLTTNDKDRLAEALIRPGRVEVQHDQFFATVQGTQGEIIQRARNAFLVQVEPRVHSFARLQ